MKCPTYPQLFQRLLELNPELNLIDAGAVGSAIEAYFTGEGAELSQDDKQALLDGYRAYLPR